MNLRPMFRKFLLVGGTLAAVWMFLGAQLPLAHSEGAKVAARPDPVSGRVPGPVVPEIQVSLVNEHSGARRHFGEEGPQRHSRDQGARRVVRVTQILRAVSPA